MQARIHSALAAAALMAVAGQAAAQSSVTVFGILDLGIRHVSNEGAGSVRSMVSGANSTSRLGFRGNEDLGGGLHAGFWLESAISADTGTSTGGNQTWDRESFVYLRSTQAGEVRLGRSLTPVYQVWSAGDAFSQVGAGSIVILYPAASATAKNPIRSAFGSNNRNASTTTRSNNMITYFTPHNLGGFHATVSVALGEGNTAALTSSSSMKYTGVTVGYAKGPLSVRFGQASTETSVTTAGNRFTDRAMHVIYDFGVAKAAVAQRHYKYMDAREDILMFSLWIPVGSGTIKLQHGRLDNRGTAEGVSIDDNDATSLALGYQHNLSKRTALYATLGRVSNSGGSAAAISGGSTAGYAAGRRSTAYEVGVRHNF